MKRIILTDNIEFDWQREYKNTRPWHKPTGLWYSINYEWLEWCLNNSTDWITNRVSEIKIDLSNILILKTGKDIKSFIKKYSRKPEKHYTILVIDWDLVRNDYDGVELRNYSLLQRNRSCDRDFWAVFSGWDCSSGCIWNLNAVKQWINMPLSKSEKARMKLLTQ
jgi:hypothetical protein